MKFKTGDLVTILVFLSVILLNPARAAGQSTIEAFLDNMYRPGHPGAVVLVRQGDQPPKVFSRGLARVEGRLAMDSNMVFPIGSITKSFTAVSVMILAEQGKLSLNGRLTDYFPEYSPEYDHVNISHLLGHTSGIASYNQAPEYRSHPDKASLTLEKMMAFSRNKPLKFDPGARFNYSNSNYIFLTAIIEKASGREYREFVSSEILEKAGMRSTYFNVSSIQGSSPQGYELSDEGVTPESEETSHTFGAGMMHSSVEDISLFLLALEKNDLVGRDSVDLLFSLPLKHRDGRPDEYAHGFWVTELDGTRTIKLEGYCRGFFTNAFYQPQTRTQVIIFPNTSGFPRPDDPTYIARWITRHLSGEPVRIFRKAEVSPGILENYQGVYRIDDENIRQVIIKGKKLYTLRTGGAIMEAVPESGDSFFYPNTFTTFSFLKDENGNLSGMRMTDDDGEAHDAALTPEPVRSPVPLSEDTLVKFTGEYDFGYSLYKISISEGVLKVNDGWRQYDLFPESDTSFYPWHEDAHWIFNKDENGKIHSLTFKKGEYERTVEKVK